MKHTILAQLRSAPVVTSLAIGLFVLAVAFWGRDAGSGPTGRSARISDVQAVLYDGEVEFSADVDLATRWGRVAFGMKELSIRSALVDLLKTKSRYMVSTTTSREALRREMLRTVNRILGGGRATEVRLPRFEML